MAIQDDFIKTLQSDFLNEAATLLEQMEHALMQLETSTDRHAELGQIFRVVHSLKGAGAAVDFPDVASFAHTMEDCLAILRVTPSLTTPAAISTLLRATDALKTRVAQLRLVPPPAWSPDELIKELSALKATLDQPTAHGGDAPRATDPTPTGAQSSAAASASTIMIDADRVESVLNLVGEMVVIKSQLTNVCAPYTGDTRLNSVLSLMEKTIRELQDRTLSMRMTPLRSLFLKTQRVVRDLSVKLGKQVTLVLDGENTEIDRAMVGLLADPLLHMARNSLDHGIEDPQRRTSAGKPSSGQIRLSAQQAGGRIVITVSDDGGGIAKDKVLKKAIEKGLATPEEAGRMTDSQIFSLIFAAGFSTADQVTDVSGRGVGMDVVKTNVEKLKGAVAISSARGQGTTMTITIPLTTSIIDGMVLDVREHLYILPIESVTELIHLGAETCVDLSTGRPTLNYRGAIIPVVDLQRRLLGNAGRLRVSEASINTFERGTVAIVDTGTSTIGLYTELVRGQAQVVLKPLGYQLSEGNGVAGAAILGDGQVALVLDPDGLRRLEAAA